MRMRAPILFFSLLLLAPAASRPLAQETPVPPADDAYHYTSWADGRQDAFYTEWWYFNLFDARSGVQAIFSYFVTNPGDLLGTGQARMVAVAYTGQGTVSAVDAYPLAAFSASEAQADVAIGDNAIRVIDADTYRIAGASRDGRLRWDLTYARAADPWLAADRMGVGSFPWEKMSWLVSMPRAEVSGRMVVDGRSYDVRAPGYHDHNWGEWFPTDALWNWGQYSDRRLSIEMGDFIGKPAGVVGVDFDGERTVFTKGQYWLLHTRWALDWKSLVWYPTESVLYAGNDTRRLWVTIRAIGTEPLRGDLPLPLRDLFIFEQTARYDGWLWEKNQEGEWAVASVIRGNGFKEYTARHY
jgi:hypothetical protein